MGKLVQLHLHGMVGHELQVGPFVFLLYYKNDPAKPYYYNPRRFKIYRDRFWWL